MEMTDAKYALVDLMLLKLPIGQPLNTFPFMGAHLLTGRDDDYPPSLIQEMRLLLVHSDRDVRQFLLNEHYIKCVAHWVPTDVLTEKGEMAKKLGGHKQYLEWEKQDQLIKQKQAAASVQHTTIYGNHNKVAGRDITEQGEGETTARKALSIHKQILIWTIAIAILTALIWLLALKGKG